MKTKTYVIFGWNFAFNASGYLPEVYETKEAAEKGVEDNKWIMDEWEIQEKEN